MQNTNNKEINSYLLSRKDDIAHFTKNYLEKEYRHLSTNGLILSPLILESSDRPNCLHSVSLVRNFFQKISKHLLTSNDEYSSLIRRSISSWGNYDFVGKIYENAVLHNQLDDFVEVGRLDLMCTKSSEINPNCIDSLIDYKELELYLLSLYSYLQIPITKENFQESFIDKMLDQLIDRAIKEGNQVRYIGWLSSYDKIYSKYWPREREVQKYANAYLKGKGIDLEFRLCTLEELDQLQLNEIGCLYSMVYPDDLGKINNTKCLDNFLNLSYENKMISPYFTYPIEHKSLQALVYMEEFVNNFDLTKEEMEVVRGIFPKTSLVCDLLKGSSFPELMANYKGYYIKNTYSWCGEKVFKMENLDQGKIDIIYHDLEINKLSWILQTPEEHLHVKHIQYQDSNSSIQELDMMADSGIQYIYNPKDNIKFFSISSRNSISHEDGIVSRSCDNVFRPSIVLFK